MHLLLRLAVVCASLAATLPLAPLWADAPKHVQVVQTFEPARNNGTPLVQVRFSNTVVGTFAIDTGEYECVMTNTFARRLGLDTAAASNLQFFGFQLIRTVQVPTLKLANLTVSGQTFRVMPQSFLPSFSGRQIDGILGGDLLARFALRIDYPAHELGWITPGDLNAETASVLGFTPQNLIELGQERAPWVSGKVNHYTLRADFQNGNDTASEDLMIDTGSFDTVISNPLAEKLRLTPLGTEVTGTLSEPLATVTRSTVAKMQIGPMVLSNVSVIAPQQKDTGFPSLLGENVLSNCVVLFDFGPHRLYLKPVLPPVKASASVPADRKLINWDRLRAAPDLPSLEEMLAGGFVPEAADTLAEQAKRLDAPLSDPAKNVERLEKLAALRQAGGDKPGAKAAFDQAITEAAAAVKAQPADGPVAGRWVDALVLAGKYEDALAAATLTTQRLPLFAPAWRQLGGALTVRVLSLLTGRQEALTEAKALRLTIPKRAPLTKAQSQLTLSLLTQAHAAFDKSVALAPADPLGYRERGVFYFVSRLAPTSLQQAGVKITLPASEVPSVEMSQALAVADWQQCAALSASDAKFLAVAAYLDRHMLFFHDRPWLAAHLKGRLAVSLPPELMTADKAQDRLGVLTKSADKAAASAAWIALGQVQLVKSEVSSDADLSWRQAVALDPANFEALSLLALHLKQNEKWVDLQGLLTQQCAAHDSVPVRLTLAAYLNGAGLPAEAEIQVRAAAALAPANATVNLVLADFLLARSNGDPAALAEAKTCLDKARLGYSALAAPEQKATLATSEAVWLALDHDPAGAERKLEELARAQPNCTQVREALAALLPY